VVWPEVIMTTPGFGKLGMAPGATTTTGLASSKVASMSSVALKERPQLASSTVSLEVRVTTTSSARGATSSVLSPVVNGAVAIRRPGL
jgi:hypothetical protein